MNSCDTVHSYNVFCSSFVSLVLVSWMDLRVVNDTCVKSRSSGCKADGGLEGPGGY